jgi:hypothetical protein
MNNYKARTTDDQKIDEPKPYDFWRGKSIRKIIDGYEVLIFLDKLGSTGICIRPEESTKQKDYILVGELFQYLRGSRLVKDIFNDLCKDGWKVAPIEVKNGYNGGALLFAPRWYPKRQEDTRFLWVTVLPDRKNSQIEQLVTLAKTTGYFVGGKVQNMKKASITELNFYI